MKNGKLALCVILLFVVAAMAGVSGATIMRGRLKDPAFNKAFLEATGRQWENVYRIRERGIRPYRRSAYII